MTDTTTTTQVRPLRFGVVAPFMNDLPSWRDQVGRIADMGYSTLLMPDVPQWQPAPRPALAPAAAIAELRVGTGVYSSPVRPAWITAWEAHSLSVLTDGRSRWVSARDDPGSRINCASWGLPMSGVCSLSAGRPRRHGGRPW
jgi:alkanesulfonate monooxygenase SsuD/methylene tetrahydromethanopterin reductase-like flavin-dependent oxidoreductase (luciferase family)